MPWSSRAWWLVAAVTFALAGQAGSVGAETQDALIKHGIDLRLAGDDEGAFRDFQKALEISRTPKAVAQVGLAEQALGRWEDADVHVAEALRANNDPWVTRNRKTLEDAMGVIKQHVARVEVVAEPAGAEILVNGRKVGKTPLPSAIRVSAGEVAVEARAAGYVTTYHTVHLVGGQYQTVVLHMEQEGGTEASKNGASKNGAGKAIESPASAANTGPSSARVVAKWSALGLGGAGLVTGVAATLIYRSRVSDFDKAANMNCADNGGTAVYKDTGKTASECQGALDGYKHARTWQIVGFAAAGVFTATWAVLALTESNSIPQTALGSTSRATRWATCLPALGVTQLSCAFTF